jgi:hypothetical protein
MAIKITEELLKKLREEYEFKFVWHEADYTKKRPTYQEFNSVIACIYLYGEHHSLISDAKNYPELCELAYLYQRIYYYNESTYDIFNKDTEFPEKEDLEKIYNMQQLLK